MRDDAELQAAAGFIAAELRAEFPGLRLDWVTVETQLRPSPRRDNAAPRRALEPLPGRQRDRDADQADPARVSRLLPPDRARPRRRARPQRSRGCRAADARPVPILEPDRGRVSDRAD